MCSRAVVVAAAAAAFIHFLRCSSVANGDPVIHHSLVNVFGCQAFTAEPAVLTPPEFGDELVRTCQQIPVPTLGSYLARYANAFSLCVVRCVVSIDPLWQGAGAEDADFQHFTFADESRFAAAGRAGDGEDDDRDGDYGDDEEVGRGEYRDSK